MEWEKTETEKDKQTDLMDLLELRSQGGREKHEGRKDSSESR